MASNRGGGGGGYGGGYGGGRGNGRDGGRGGGGRGNGRDGGRGYGQPNPQGPQQGRGSGAHRGQYHGDAGRVYGQRNPQGSQQGEGHYHGDRGAGRNDGQYQRGRGGRGNNQYRGANDGYFQGGRDYYQGDRAESSNAGGRHHFPGRGQGQHYDSASSSAQSDLPQASLVKHYADAAAAKLAADFANMRFESRSESLFPRRPQYGAAGRPYRIKANHFFVGLTDKNLCHYNVKFDPEPTTRSLFRAIMSRLVSQHQDSGMGGLLPAYDGRYNLFTAGRMPFVSKDFIVTLPADGQRAERKFTVDIRFTNEVSLLELLRLMAGESVDIPSEALQVLDIVLRDIVLNERNDMNYVAVGRSFFSPSLLGSCTKIGQGLVAWKGFYQSIRPTQMGLSLNIDMSSTAFVGDFDVTNFVIDVLGRDFSRKATIDRIEYAKLKKALRGLRIEVTHRGNQNRKYRIIDLSLVPCSDVKFESSSGVTITIPDYFLATYQRKLEYTFLPCLQVGRPDKVNYLPMEVCKILTGQKYSKKLDNDQVEKLRKTTCQDPPRREASICKTVRDNHYNDADRAVEFGIEVDPNPAKIEARVLPAPMLRYHETGGERTCMPNCGQWNLRNKKVVNSGKVSRWACVNFSNGVHRDDAREFCGRLANMCRASGLAFPDLGTDIIPADPSRVHSELQKAYQRGGQGLDLLVAILPDKNGDLYGHVKRICETELGIVTQCCLTKNVLKMNAQTLANIALKINAKVGGRNAVLENVGKSMPVVSKMPTIIFGADVTHPSPMDDSTPSIAAVVASQDWPEVTKYAGLVRAQGLREELIQGLEDIVKELLISFQNESKQKPKQLIFYRDGVSEGQFKQVWEKEIPEIEKAWRSLYNDKPNITFIVVQKRHHTRLFPVDPFDTDKSKNILPGTVVDRQICHPTEFDFYLCSHAGIQGTSRPTHYHVLRDDCGFSADDLQSLTNNLCYTYASCTRSVSIAPPAYYAHKLAFRARFYLEQDAAAGGQAPPPAGGVRQLSALRDNLKRVMFYC